METHDIDILIGKNLKRIRKIKELTQDELGKLIKNPATKISALENGKEGLGKDLMSKLCTALNIKPAEFYSEPNIEIEDISKEKKDILTKLIEITKDMETEEIREILKHTEKEKFWKENKNKIRKKKHN